MASQASVDNIKRLGDDENNFVGKLLDELERAEGVLNPWKNKLVTYYELYKMYQRNKHYQGLADIFVPEILRGVETIVGQMYSAIFGSDPWYEYCGRTEEDEPGARALTQLVDWQMDINNFRICVQDSIRQMAITGLTVRKMGWDFEQVNSKRRAMFEDPERPGKKKAQTIDELKTTRDHWVFKGVDLLGFYISDVSTPYHDIQKARWIGEEYEVDKTWLKENIKKNWLADNHIDEIDETSLSQRSDAQRLKDSLRLTSGYSDTSKKKGILIFERWGLLEAHYVYSQEQLDKLELDRDDMVEAVFMLANRKFLVKLEANPYWHGQKPYLSCPYVPQENEFAGIGATQIGQSLQQELNDTRNQTMDNKTLVLMCMWLKSRSSGIKNQDLRIRPNGVVVTNDMNGLKPLQPPILSGVGVNIEGIIKNDLRESIGAPSNLQGIAQSGVSTATESSQINATAMGRLRMTVQLYTQLILKPMFNFIEYLNYQYYDTEKVISVIGANGVSFVKRDPDDIIGYKDVVIKTNSDMEENPGVRRQQAMQFLTIVQQLQPQQINYYWKLLDKLYKMFFPQGHSLADVLPAPDLPEEMMEPDAENDVMLMGHHVKVHSGDDDQKHIEAHQKSFDMFKYVLSEKAFKEYTQHLLEHHDQLSQKLAAQAQQAKEEALAQVTGGGAAPGNQPGMVPGQMSGMTAFTQPDATTPGDIAGKTGV